MRTHLHTARIVVRIQGRVEIVLTRAFIRDWAIGDGNVIARRPHELGARKSSAYNIHILYTSITESPLRVVLESLVIGDVFPKPRASVRTQYKPAIDNS